MTDYKKDFPLLKDSQVAYLDNAATAQRPLAVLEAEKDFYEKYNANPLRGLYELGMEATERYEEARSTVKEFLHARKSCEIIFTRNTTESINLVAYSYGLHNLKAGDDIILELKEENGVIVDGAFAGSGCAISQASVDIMLELIIGKTKEEALKLADLFSRMIKGEVTGDALEPLEEAMSLADISKMPARVKCAVLGWHTMEELLDKKKE